jgi:hypothetical protein
MLCYGKSWTITADAAATSTVEQYARARLVRTESGHQAALPLYQALLRDNPDDVTTATRLAAAVETPARHDAACRLRLLSFSSSSSSSSSSVNAHSEESNSSLLNQKALQLRHLLWKCNYHLSTIQSLLGISDGEGISRNHPANAHRLYHASCPIYVTPSAAGSSTSYPWQQDRHDEPGGVFESEPPTSPTAVQCLTALFLLGLAVPRETLLQCRSPPLEPADLQLLQDLGLLYPCSTDPDLLIAHVQIFPLSLTRNNNNVNNENVNSKNNNNNIPNTLYLVTDWHPRVLSSTTAGTHDAVMYIGPDSLALVQHWLGYYQQITTTSTPPPTMVVDICTGSGIQALSALAMLDWCPTAQAVCVDVSPRALRFTAFNAALNGLQDRVQYVLGNVLSGQGQLWIPPREQIISEPTTIEITTAITAETSPTTERTADEFPESVYEAHDRPLLEVLREAIARAIPPPPPQIPDGIGSDDDTPPMLEQEQSMHILITANPPFLPVPPDILQARHGLFSAGGPSGESCVASIVHLASQLLPENGHGYLALVSEFFLQQEDGDKEDNATDDSDDANDNNTNADHTDHTDVSKKESTTTVESALSRAASTSTSTAASALMERMKTWWGPVPARGLLLTNQFPVSADTYAERRADSPHEQSVWLEHLQDLDIAAASPGFLYIQKVKTTTVTKQRKHDNSSECENENDIENENENDNCGAGDNDDEGILALRHMKVPKSKWGSIWTPSNPAGVEFTQSVCQHFFVEDIPSGDIS